MQETKKRLKVIQGQATANPVVPGTTCFAEQARHGVDCQRQRCKHWISHTESHNCVILAANDGPHTLQKIGQIYDLTRMRICQIEKSLFERIRQLS